MLVDMAGSENIEQAGQTGLDAKMQAKFSQYFLNPNLNTWVSHVGSAIVFYL